MTTPATVQKLVGMNIILKATLRIKICLFLRMSHLFQQTYGKFSSEAAFKYSFTCANVIAGFEI